MVNIFARSTSGDLASLVKRIDDVVGANQDKQMRAFVVLLTDDPDAAAADLTSLANDQGIQHTPLTTYDGVDGPAKYRISEDAEVTILMWAEKKIKVNHAFGPGELNASAINTITADTALILD